MGTRFQYQNQRLRLWLLLRWQKKNKDPDLPVDGGSHYNMSGGRNFTWALCCCGNTRSGVSTRRSGLPKILNIGSTHMGHLAQSKITFIYNFSYKSPGPVRYLGGRICATVPHPLGENGSCSSGQRSCCAYLKSVST